MSFGARARIDLSAIQHNLGVIRAKAPAAKIMAVVKANAYGHGLIPVASMLGSAEALAVARLTEAKALRDASIGNDIVLMGGALSPSELDIAATLGLQVCVQDQSQLADLESYRGPPLVVWLKIDTGMHRLGIACTAATEVVTRLSNCSAVSSVHVMTHFANADAQDDALTLRQLDRLLLVAEFIPGDISVANSPAVFNDSGLRQRMIELSARRNVWIRPGLALYGASPFTGVTGEALGLKPAMQFESRLIAVKPLAAGEPVGYGGTWQSSRDTTLGIIRAGYGDGYSRYIPSGAPVLLNGREVPVAGRISMDLTAVDLGPAALDRPGDEVVLWGATLPVERIAEWAQTIPYQLLCGVMHREPALFEGGEMAR